MKADQLLEAQVKFDLFCPAARRVGVENAEPALKITNQRHYEQAASVKYAVAARVNERNVNKSNGFNGKRNQICSRLLPIVRQPKMEEIDSILTDY